MWNLSTSNVERRTNYVGDAARGGEGCGPGDSLALGWRPPVIGMGKVATAVAAACGCCGGRRRSRTAAHGAAMSGATETGGRPALWRESQAPPGNSSRHRARRAVTPARADVRRRRGEAVVGMSRPQATSNRTPRSRWHPAPKCRPVGAGPSTKCGDFHTSAPAAAAAAGGRLKVSAASRPSGSRASCRGRACTSTRHISGSRNPSC